MRERLTKKEVIQEHHKMWNWIASQYRDGRKDRPIKLKEEYLELMGFKNIKGNCFCCQYDYQEGEIRCVNSRNSPYRKMLTYYEDTWVSGRTNNYYMAKLAIKVANLPEREEIL